MADSRLRLLHIARLIPAAPQQVSTKALLERLSGMGLKVELRTLQRDLKTLIDSGELGIEQTEPTGRGKEGVGYRYRKGTGTLGPAMDYPSALTLVMAKDHVSKLMPDEVLQAMEPLFNQAESSLGSDRKNVRGRWRDKVRSVPKSIVFQKPKVDRDIYRTVTTALLENKCINITYKQKEYVLIHPLALVDRGLETLLVAYVAEYNDLRQFMIHRMQSATATTFSVKRPIGFDIDTVIASGYFSVPVKGSQGKPIQLKIRLFEQAGITSARLIVEGTPLSDDQTIVVPEDGSYAEVTATVHDTHELRMWLLSLGARAEVTGPVYLREFIIETVSCLNTTYSIR